MSMDSPHTPYNGMLVACVNSADAEYDKTKKIMKLSSSFLNNKFPRMFNMKSFHTGKIVGFKSIDSDDPLFDQDQWDGEQGIYRPIIKLDNVDYLVVYNG